MILFNSCGENKNKHTHEKSVSIHWPMHLINFIDKQLQENLYRAGNDNDEFECASSQCRSQCKTSHNPNFTHKTSIEKWSHTGKVEKIVSKRLHITHNNTIRLASMIENKRKMYFVCYSNVRRRRRWRPRAREE